MNANREKVAKLTNGRAGYLHVPDMGADGIREFIKWYYPQIRKEGLVVDVRSNGGGNVSRVAHRAARREAPRRRILAARRGRRTHIRRDRPPRPPRRDPATRRPPPDGDIFPHMFRKAGLGPLVGKRTGAASSASPARPDDRRRDRLRPDSAAPTTPTASGSSRATASTPTSSSRTTRPRDRGARPAAGARRRGAS